MTMAASRSTRRKSNNKKDAPQNRRMAWTLGCLVASMTAGAMLLDWAQPNQSLMHADRTQLMSLVRDAIEPSGETADGKKWQSIYIDPQRPGMDRSTLQSHFLIARDGRLSPTERGRQMRLADSDGVVRIGLLAGAHSNEITPAQWSTTKQLIKALQDECRISSQQVKLDDTLSLPLACLTPNREAGHP